MEGIMKRFALLLIFIPSFAFSASTHFLYYKNTFGHIHQAPSSYSASAKSISCGDRVALVQEKTNTSTEFSKYSWVKVKYGPSEGFVRTDFLIPKRPTCFQASYRKFFNKFKLELRDVFSWGRLYDQYVVGSSKVR